MGIEPLVSVILPTFTRGFLGEALESALQQTHENLEIIVVDDGSSDGTGDYVRDLRSDRVTYVPLEHIGHPAPVRNAGLKIATGEYVAFLDSDDKWMPDKIKTQLKALAEHPDVDLVASDMIKFPSDRPRPFMGLKEPRVVDLRDLLRANMIANSSVVVRRSAVDEAGFQDEDLPTCEDYDYWLRIVRNGTGSALILPEALMMYRRHQGNIGIEDIEHCDRLSTVVGRHRDFDEAYVDRILRQLRDEKAFRQARVDIESGESSLPRAIFRREIRWRYRLALIKHYGPKARPYQPD